MESSQSSGIDTAGFVVCLDRSLCCLAAAALLAAVSERQPAIIAVAQTGQCTEASCNNSTQSPARASSSPYYSSAQPYCVCRVMDSTRSSQECACLRPPVRIGCTPGHQQW
jgi:hypothetical protein